MQCMPLTPHGLLLPSMLLYIACCVGMRAGKMQPYAKRRWETDLPNRRLRPSTTALHSPVDMMGHAPSP